MSDQEEFILWLGFRPYESAFASALRAELAQFDREMAASMRWYLR